MTTRRLIAAAFLVACLLVAPLTAQDDAGAQGDSTVTAKSLGLPKEKKAFTLSLTGTLASWGLMLVSFVPATGDAPSETSSALGIAGVAGIMIGPSLGSFYGGCWGRGLLLTGLRVGVTMLAIGYFMENDEKDNTAVGALMVGALIGSAIYECATVKSAVRKHNAAHLAKQNMKIAVAPFAVRKGAGLNVQMSF